MRKRRFADALLNLVSAKPRKPVILETKAMHELGDTTESYDFKYNGIQVYGRSSTVVEAEYTFTNKFGTAYFVEINTHLHSDLSPVFDGSADVEFWSEGGVETEEGDQYRVMATIADVLDSFVNFEKEDMEAEIEDQEDVADPEIRKLVFTPVARGNVGPASERARGKLFKAFAKNRGYDVNFKGGSGSIMLERLERAITESPDLLKEAAKLVKELGDSTNAASFSLVNKDVSPPDQLSLKYEFETDLGTEYVVLAELAAKNQRGSEVSGKYVAISFHLKENTSYTAVSNKGEISQVMATVLSITEEIWDRRQNLLDFDGFMFQPSGDNKKRGQRFRLYKVYINRQFPSAGLVNDKRKIFVYPKGVPETEGAKLQKMSVKKGIAKATYLVGIGKVHIEAEITEDGIKSPSSGNFDVVDVSSEGNFEHDTEEGHAIASAVSKFIEKDQNKFELEVANSSSLNSLKVRVYGFNPTSLVTKSAMNVVKSDLGYGYKDGDQFFTEASKRSLKRIAGIIKKKPRLARTAMRRLKEMVPFISEIGDTDSTVDFRFTDFSSKPGHMLVRAKADELDLEVTAGYSDAHTFSETHEGLAVVNFDRGGEYKDTVDDGNHFLTVATVLDVIDEIWQRRDEIEIDLRGFRFSGAGGQGPKARQRERLFRTFIKRKYPDVSITDDGEYVIIKP